MKIPTPRPAWADEPTQEHPTINPRSGLADIIASGVTARYVPDLGIWLPNRTAGENGTPGQVPNV